MAMPSGSDRKYQPPPTITSSTVRTSATAGRTSRARSVLARRAPTTTTSSASGSPATSVTWWRTESDAPSRSAADPVATTRQGRMAGRRRVTVLMQSPP
jgi:hypothetical protein